MADTSAGATPATVPAGARVVLLVSRGPNPAQPAGYAPVPDLSGSDQGTALKGLQEAGLQARVFNDFSSSHARGKVMGQLPAAGLTAPVGSEVVLLVSSGKSEAAETPVLLPDLVGKREEDAIAELQRSALAAQVTRDFSPTVPEGVVMAQLPNRASLAAAPKRSLAWLWILLALLVVAGAVAAFLLLGQGKKVVVPDVEGKPVAEAVAEIEDAGLEAKVEEADEDAEGEEGTVVKEDPPAGTEVDEGDEITLDVIRPPEQVDVPDVVGLSQDEATGKLEDAGLRPNVKTETSESVKEGNVISQSPEAGTKADPGSRVDITVAKAPEAPKQVEVPDVTGASQSDAESKLKDVGLGVDVSEIPSENVDKGDVIAQLPAAGTIVSPDTTVAIVVSTGPPAEDASVEVPSVVGQELNDAEEALTKLGLVANPTPVAGTAENKGDVLAQAPDAGTMVPPGTAITLLYAE